MMGTARNWGQRIFEPGTTFLIRDQVAQNPNFQISNNRRAAAYAGDVAGSMILAPLLASTATQVGAGLYNAAAPEALDIPAEGLANLAALGAMGYGAYRGIARFHNAGNWPGFKGKFADRATIATPGPGPKPDAGPVSIPIDGPEPPGPMPGSSPAIYPRSIVIEDGNPLPPPFTEIPIAVASPAATKATQSAVPTVPTAVVPDQVVPATTAIVSSKTARNQEPVTIAVPAQQVPESTIQDMAALAMQEEAERRARAHQLTLTHLHGDPYSSDILNSWQIQP